MASRSCTTFRTKCGQAMSTPRSTTSRPCRSTGPRPWSTTPTTCRSVPPSTRRQHRVDQPIGGLVIGVHEVVECAIRLGRGEVVALVELVARPETGADEIPRQSVDGRAAFGVDVVGAVQELVD